MNVKYIYVLILFCLIDSSIASYWCFENVEGRYEYCINNISESTCYYNECVDVDATKDVILYRRINSVDVDMDFTQDILSKLLFGLIYFLVLATLIIGGIRILMGRRLF